jgi:hypothetical protein
MTWRIRRDVWWYLSILWATILLFCFGFTLVYISLLNPAFLEWSLPAATNIDTWIPGRLVNAGN